MSPNEQRSEHLSAADVAAYLDGKLSAADKARAEAHLAACAECRHEVVDLRAVLANGDTDTPAARGAPTPVQRRWRRFSAPVGMAAAAVVLITLATTLRRPTPGVERAPSDPAGARLQTHAPVDGVSPTRVVFVWASAEPGSSYRLTLTDAAGAPVWSTTTTDTVLALPAAAKLGPGGRYHWYVDALRPDGQTITSGVRSFSTAR